MSDDGCGWKRTDVFATLAFTDYYHRHWKLLNVVVAEVSTLYITSAFSLLSVAHIFLQFAVSGYLMFITIMAGHNMF